MTNLSCSAAPTRVEPKRRARWWSGALTLLAVGSPLDASRAADAPSTAAVVLGPGPAPVAEPHTALPAAGAVDEPAWREELAAIRLDLAVQRDVPAAIARLDDLFAAVLSAPPFAGQVGLLTDVTVSRAELYLEIGELARAADSLRQLVGHSDHTPDPAAAVALWEQVVARPGVVALAARIEAQRQRPASTLDEEMLGVVRDALATEDQKLLDDLGTRQVPYLVELFDPAQVVTHLQGDPLWHLAQRDPDRFWTVCRRVLEDGTLEQPLRVLHPMAQYSMWRSVAWLTEVDHRPRLRSAVRVEVLHRLFAHPRLVDHDGALSPLAQLLGNLRAWDGLPAEAARALGRTLLGADADSVAYLLRARSVPRADSFVPLHEELMLHPAAAVRAECAALLARHPAGPALLAAHDDIDPRVRRHVAEALTERAVELPIYMEGRGPTHVLKGVLPVLGEAELGVLSVLARDVDTEVRATAARALVEPAGRRDVAPELYVDLARDPAVAVRQILAGLTHPDPAVVDAVIEVQVEDADAVVRMTWARRDDLLPDQQRRALLTLAGDDDVLVRSTAAGRLAALGGDAPTGDTLLALARDPAPTVRAAVGAQVRHADPAVELAVLEVLVTGDDPEMLAAVDQRLATALGQGDEWREDAARWLELLQARRDHPTRPLRYGDRPLGADVLPSEFMASAEGKALVTRWALARGRSEDWQLATIWMGKRGQGGDRSSIRDGYQAAFALLDDAELTGLLANYRRHDVNGLDWLLAYRAADVERHGAWLRRTVADPEAPMDARLVAASALASEADATLADQVFGWLVPRTWAELLSVEVRALDRLVTELPRELALGLALRSLEATQMDDRLEARIVKLVVDAHHGLEHVPLITALLTHGMDNGLNGSSIDQAVLALRQHPDAMPASWVHDQARGGSRWRMALSVLGARRRPEDLPVLAECLRAPWAVMVVDRPERVAMACNAVVAQLSDAAADVLLAAAAEASVREERDMFMRGVQSIQDYQDARASWERRVADAGTREQSVARLVKLIHEGTPAQRVQAVRSLATLGAVDQLPLLVELLADGDAAVVAAATAALDALHAASVSASDEAG